MKNLSIKYVSEENLKELCQKYKFLIPSDWCEHIKEFGYSAYLEIPIGWYDIFVQMCEDLQKAICKYDQDEIFCLVEMKYNVENNEWSYVSSINDFEQAESIIDKYCLLTERICPNSGKFFTNADKSYIIQNTDEEDNITTISILREMNRYKKFLLYTERD